MAGAQLWFSVFPIACYPCLPSWPVLNNSAPSGIPGSQHVPNRQSILLSLLISIISHPYCFVCFRPSLSPLCTIIVSSQTVSLPIVFSPVELSSTNAFRELSKSQLQSRPSLSSQPFMAHLAQGMPSPFLTWTLNRFCGLYVHPIWPSPFPGIALTISHESCYSSQMGGIEARIQILITAFLVYFTAFHLTRQFQKQTPQL